METKPTLDVILKEHENSEICNNVDCSRDGKHKYNGQKYCQTCINIVIRRDMW